VKKEGFNLTPNITPIKEALPDKKILVRSFSKGVLIPSQNQTNNSSLQKKVERINGFFSFLFGFIVLFFLS